MLKAVSTPVARFLMAVIVPATVSREIEYTPFDTVEGALTSRFFSSCS
jgi:hypothetical protein